MKKQTITILLAALVLQLAITAYVYRPGQGPAQETREFFSGLSPSQVTAMAITDDEGKSITLNKGDKGWTVGPAGYPGDKEDIERVLKKITGLKASRIVTRTRASHPRLKVADTLFNRKVVLTTSGGEKIFYLGAAPSAKTIHLRMDGEDEVYLVKDLASWELQTGKESWWQGKYVDWNQEKLTGLTVRNANGEIILGRDKDGGWVLEGGEDARGDKDKIISLVSTLSTISVADYLPPDSETPAADPVATVVYRQKDGEVTLTIWPKTKDENDYTAKNSASPFFATIRGYVVEDILKARKDDLIAPPAPDTAKEEGQTAASGAAETEE